MQYILEQLEQDHRRMLRMMYLLSKDIHRLTGLDKGAANMDRILEILDYIQVYPEIWHHPTEDVLFKHLLSKEQVNVEAIQLLLNDHPRLEALSNQLSLIYSEFRAAGITPSQRVLQLSRHFCSGQITHIHAERNIFAAISERFTEQDWEAIGNTLRDKQNSNEKIDEQQDYIHRSEHLNRSNALTNAGLH